MRFEQYIDCSKSNIFVFTMRIPVNTICLLSDRFLAYLYLFRRVQDNNVPILKELEFRALTNSWQQKITPGKMLPLTTQKI